MNKLTETIRISLRHELIKGSSWLFLGTIISSFLAFLTNLFLARSLSIEDYGIYASLLSLVTIATIPSKSIVTVIVKFAGSFFANNKKKHAALLYKKLLYLSLIFSFLIFLLLFILSPILSNFLHIKNNMYVIISSIIIVFSYLGIVNQSYLVALLNFPYITMASMVGSLLRMLSAVVLILASYQVYGALWSVVISYFAQFALKFIPLRFLFNLKVNKTICLPKRKIFNYSFFSIISLLSISSLSSTDIILARHFLSPHDAGLYGGLSLVGKVIVYCTSPISSVMFPIIVKKYEKKQKYEKTFYLSLFIGFVISALITFFYYLFPEFTINFFLNRDVFQEVNYLLWPFGMFIAISSLITIIVNFMLSIHKTNVVFLSAFFCLLQVLLIYLYHSSISQIIWVSIMTCILFLVSLILFSYKEIYHKNENNKILKI